MPCSKCNKPVNYKTVHVDLMIYTPGKGYDGLRLNEEFCKECAEKAAELIEEWIEEEPTHENT